MRCALLVLLGLAAGAAHGGTVDTIKGLIVYTNYTVQTGQITEFNATLEVPPLPALSGGQPKFWIGLLCPHVRNYKPPYDIIQAAMELGRSGNGYDVMTTTVTSGGRENSGKVAVEPGQLVTMWLKYDAEGKQYAVGVTRVSDGETTQETVSDQGHVWPGAFVAVEHPVDDCKMLPPSGKLAFSSIYVTVDNKPVAPKWLSQSGTEICNASIKSTSPQEVVLTWDV